MQLLDEPEALGRLALMLLHEARRSARVDAAGDIVLLEDQQRSLWDRARIGQAQALIERAHCMRSLGPYLLQAAIRRSCGSGELRGHGLGSDRRAV